MASTLDSAMDSADPEGVMGDQRGICEEGVDQTAYMRYLRDRADESAEQLDPLESLSCNVEWLGRLCIDLSGVDRGVALGAAWCFEQGYATLSEVHEANAVDELVQAMELKHGKARIVANRLAATCSSDLADSGKTDMSSFLHTAHRIQAAIVTEPKARDKLVPRQQDGRAHRVGAGDARQPAFGRRPWRTSIRWPPRDATAAMA